MNTPIDNRITKDMKYIALYWALGFEEIEPDIFVKKYGSTSCTISAKLGIATFDKGITIINSYGLKLNTHKSFVVLECIDRLLSLGYPASTIIVDLDNEFDVYCGNSYIRCVEWGLDMNPNSIPNPKKEGSYLSILYSSRLYSGLIDRKEIIKNGDETIYDFGFFESRFGDLKLSVLSKPYKLNGFEIVGDEAVSYDGNEKVVIVPDGVRKLASSLFWDNQIIEEVICPDSVEELGGDLFYNCRNLKRFTIGKNVVSMGDNPFAGCPDLELNNQSTEFEYKEYVLIGKKDGVIYCSIKKQGEYIIPDGIKLIGKHAFYMCDKLTKVVIPSSLIHMKNFPFSGCKSLTLENHSRFYEIDGSVVYSRNKEVIGCLCSCKTSELVIKNGTERICRNSFYSCNGIKKLILPKSLKVIGYNPFVQCGDIEFVSNSPEFVVDNGILFNKDKTKIICCPRNKAVGDFVMPESVNVLERSAFSGCDFMTSIDLKNVSTIGKSCFTNCNSLRNIFVPDWVTYIGEWAFAHCSSLEKVSIYKDTFLDKNPLENTKAFLEVRKSRGNYIIESDNLYSLKGIQDSLNGKVDSILIDPPYNSNISYIGYKDSGFNDGWINFIKDRIILARKLLTKNGFLVINIDEGERDELFDLCKTIFLEGCVSLYKWKKINPFFDKNRIVLNPNKKQTPYEYIIICKNTLESKLNSIKQPYIDGDKLMEKDSKVPAIFDCFGTTSSAKDEMQEIFGDRTYFSTPKPLKLMKELVRATTNKNSIVIDFFAGSGTTGDAVDSLNKEDKGNRSFILISNSENNICKNVTVERLNKRNIDFHFQ